MNEWLGKSPEYVPSDLSPSTELGPPVPPSDLALPPGAPKLSNLSNRLYYPTREHCAGFAGFGKKRWLRQAISEETEAPLGMRLSTFIFYAEKGFELKDPGSLRSGCSEPIYIL